MKVDAQRPSTWRKYAKGMCDGCWAGCCTLPLEVSASDLIRMGLTDELEAGTSLLKLSKRLKAAKIVRSYNAKSGVFMIEQKHGRDCIYLGPDRRCTIYEKRPEVCRQFPKIGPRPGFCPASKTKSNHT
jgi:uncharacterized protein